MRVPTSDEIRGVLNGHREAVELFVRWLWPRARRIAFLMTHDLGTAEDLAQDTVIAAINGLPGFDRSRSLEPWVDRIAANKALDRLRHDGARPEESYGSVPEVESSQLVDETAALMREALSADVVDAIRSLSPAQRSAVVLRHLLDFTPEEIAAISGTPPATIRSHIYRGLSNLRSALSDETEGAR